MTTDFDTTAEVAAPRILTPDDVWDRLDDLRRQSKLPAPANIGLFAGHRGIDIRLDRNERGHADRWAEALGVSPPRLGVRFGAGGTGDGWFSYDSGSSRAVPLLPGWKVLIWCSVDTDVDASHHWTGLILHSGSTPDETTSWAPMDRRGAVRLSSPDEIIAAFEYAETNGIKSDPELAEACQQLAVALRDPEALLK